MRTPQNEKPRVRGGAGIERKGNPQYLDACRQLYGTNRASAYLPRDWKRRLPDPAMSAPKLTGNRCQCTACGEYFNGVQPFDKHRIGIHGADRRCLDVMAMEAAGFIRNAAGFWTSEGRPQRAARQRAAAISTRRAPPEGVERPPDTTQAPIAQAGAP